MRIAGTDRVIRNMHRQIAAIRTRTKAGLWEAALKIKADALPLTPIDIGNLRQSAYVEMLDGPSGPVAEIGYTAAYAVYVHERLELAHKSPTQAKFLEEALKRNAANVVTIIKQRAQQ